MESITKIGIIDCNKYQSGNPVLDHIKKIKNLEIEFIILSHLHLDHFSGMSDLLLYCMSEQIKVKYFYSTMHPLLGDLYNKIFTSQRLQKEIEQFIKIYDVFDDFVSFKAQITPHLQKIELSIGVYLGFLAPTGNIYEKMARQLSRKVNQITASINDVNKLASIILIENANEAVLLTSDAVKRAYKHISLTKEIILVQIPHHGSWYNIKESFWAKLNKTSNCPAVVSVGASPKDKLPNKETIEFFINNGYDIYSTNACYGILEYFNLPDVKSHSSTSSALNTFSKLRCTYSSRSQDPKYQGEKEFQLL